MRTLEVLLSLRAGLPSDALDAPLAGAARRIADDLPTGAMTHVVHNVRHHRDDALRAGNSLERLDEFVTTGLVPDYTKVPIASFDAVLEVSAPDDTDPELVLGAIDGLADRLGGVVDPARSAAVLGVDHLIMDGPIMDGTAPVRVFVCLYRVARISHREFCDWWLHELVEHTTKTPGKTGYRQLHADSELTVRAAKAAGVEIEDIDGVALEFYPDLDKIYAASDWGNSPRSGIVEAETQMIDFTRALGIITYAPGG